MKHLETSSTEHMVHTRPLFSSAWLALFTVLRKNYNERHLVVSAKPEHLHKVGKKQSDLKLSSV
jgi:hypothetical protein